MYLVPSTYDLGQSALIPFRVLQALKLFYGTFYAANGGMAAPVYKRCTYLLGKYLPTCSACA
jgi:hypothetical protein